MDETACAGIDVGLDQLTVAVCDHDSWREPREFANNKQGHRQLLRFLKRLGKAVRVCLEPTSTYHLSLCYALNDAPHCTVCLADPRAVKDFAAASIKRAKTDRCDARTLAHYLRLLKPAPWQPPRHLLRDLRCLSRRTQNVTKHCTALKNQIHAARRGLAPKSVLRDLAQDLRTQEKRLKKLRREMLSLVRNDDQLLESYRRLQSVTGIGEITALKLLAELSLLPPGMRKSQWVAAAGLDPQPRESGKSLHAPRRISRRGNKHLRQALFMPALVASGRCPEVKRYYEMLLKRGLAKMAALCAIMRKLLQAIWGMFQTKTSFNPARFC